MKIVLVYVSPLVYTLDMNKPQQSNGGQNMKTSYTVETPVGTFTRKTASAYTHIRVLETNWGPSQLKQVEGYRATWHKTLAAAQKATYAWNPDAPVVGIFPVA